MDGVLKSWAIPKEPSMVPEVKRLAIQMENRPLEYTDFEQNTLPQHHGDAERVETWDRGEYELLNLKDWKLIINLHGRRLNGKYVLVKIKLKGDAKGKNWLFFRKK